MTGPTETVTRVEPRGTEATPSLLADHESPTWWDRFLSNAVSLSATALEVLAYDSQNLCHLVAPRAGSNVDVSAFSLERVRTGIVVGSVQSGKTASMLALAARCLDEGVDVLVILSGTRIALWLQTYERLLKQLDGSSPQTAYRRAEARVLVPDPADVLGDERASASSYLKTQRRAVERAVRECKPVIIVVPKEDDHLIELGRFLRQAISTTAVRDRKKPVEFVVLDDEADDASVLDSTQPEKVTPRLVQQLWSLRSSGGETWMDAVYATYVAYTATPQANFVQSAHNPLAPRHFRFVLRTPDQAGPISPRALTYEEPQGIRSYYTGGRTFYERLRGRAGDFCVDYPFPSLGAAESTSSYQERFVSQRWQMLGDALRAYFVAGAIRLKVLGRRFSSIASHPVPLDELQSVLPPVHSMLYHPSALTNTHFRGAEDIAKWSCAAPGEEGAAVALVDCDGRYILSSEGLVRRLAAEEEKWHEWMAKYSSTAEALRLLPKGDYPRIDRLEWSELKELLQSEVFPATSIRVINSDPLADERPNFAPRESEGGFLPPSELFSIFVAGNVLSRGLTIEGLTTSLFLRTANEPAADTQMQMQRWFGFRGSILPFCRVLMFADQLELFRAYYWGDEALKQDILLGLNGDTDVIVLRGDDFVATAKVATRQAPLHPGPTPAVRIVEYRDANLVQQNIDLVAQLLEATRFVPLEAPVGKVRGLISEQPCELSDVATILEGLRYSNHDPQVDLPLYARWKSLQLRLRAPDSLIRVPGINPGMPLVGPRGCPFSIAAYLRLWHAALEQPQAPGLYPTDRSNLSWHLVDLASYRRTRPRFYVGIRFGGEGLCLDPRLARRQIGVVRRAFDPNHEDMLEVLWGTRGDSSSYLGDQLFDYHHHGTEPVPALRDGTLWRPRGHPGLLLLHLVHHPGKNLDMVAVGLALPHGGPDHIAALRGRDF